MQNVLVGHLVSGDGLGIATQLARLLARRHQSLCLNVRLSGDWFV